MKLGGLSDLYNHIRQSDSEKNEVSLYDIERRESRHRDYKAIKGVCYLAVYSHRY